MGLWFTDDLYANNKPLREWDKITTNGNPAIPHDPFGQKLCNFLELDMKEGPWLAGGSVRKLYFREMIGHSDWDIWFQSEQQFDDAIARVERLVEATRKHSSKNAITYSIKGESVQFIKRNFYPSVDKLLDSFDITVCQFATDGTIFKVGDLAISDSNKKIIRIRKDILTPGIMKRITKYIVYGFRPTQEMLDSIEENKNLINFYCDGCEYDE